MVQRCTLGKSLHMVIPPKGVIIYCPVHPGGHLVGGPAKVSL